jgi:hypothetical protein
LRRRFLISSSIIFLLFLLFMRGGQLFTSFGRNLANTAIYRSFSQEQTDAASRQEALSMAAAWLEREAGETGETAAGAAMIPASLRGLYHHRLGDWQNAAEWYDIAANEEPLPEQQKQLLISPWMKLEPSGDFELLATTSEWHLRADSAPGAEIIRNNRNSLEFTCSDISKKTKIATLEWSQPFDIPYHHTLVLKAKTKIGTTLNLETVIDRQLVRHVTHDGTGKWETFSVPLEGDSVKYIYVIVREDAESSARSCLVEIETISFLLDSWVKDNGSG